MFTSGQMSPSGLSTPPLSTALTTPSLSTPPPPLLSSNVTSPYALTPSSSNPSPPISNNSYGGPTHAPPMVHHPLTAAIHYEHHPHHDLGQQPSSSSQSGVMVDSPISTPLCSSTSVAPLDNCSNSPSSSYTLAPPCTSPMKADTPCSTTTLTVLQPPNHGRSSGSSDSSYSALELTHLTQYTGRLSPVIAPIMPIVFL